MSPASTPTAYLENAGDVLAFAHRGGAHHPEIEGLENSLRAFRHAHALGYTYLETDVHVTVDGVLLAFHDDVLERVTDATGPLAERTWDQVREAKIAGREPVPTFAELLVALPHARFNVDLKSDRAGRALVAVIDEHHAWDRVMVGSFSSQRLRKFRRLSRGRVATSAHPLEVVAYRLLPSGRLARLLTRGRPRALQVPFRRGRITVVTRGFVRRAHAAGLHVHVWTIDDVAQMEDLLDRGVDGLITDRTDLLKDTLQRHGLWKDHA